LYVASITQHNVTMPAGPLESKVSEQDRAQFTHKWNDKVSRCIWMILQSGSRNLAKFSAENCWPQ